MSAIITTFVLTMILIRSASYSLVLNYQSKPMDRHNPFMRVFHTSGSYIARSSRVAPYRTFLSMYSSLVSNRACKIWGESNNWMQESRFYRNVRSLKKYSSSLRSGSRLNCQLLVNQNQENENIRNDRYHIVQGQRMREHLINLDSEFSSLNSSFDKERQIIVLEAAKETQEKFVSEALEMNACGVQEDPYGIVIWPAAYALTKLLLQRDNSNDIIVELGSGVGLVSIGVSLFSHVKYVVATDYNSFALASLQKAWDIQNECKSRTDNRDKKDLLQTLPFDLKDFDVELPEGSLYVMADVLYNPPLGRVVAKRVAEAVRKGKMVILADSPGRTGREYMIQALHNDYRDIDYEISEMKVNINQGYRHDLISSDSQKQKVVSVAIFNFKLRK